VSDHAHHIDRLEIPGTFTAPRLKAVATVLTCVGVVTFIALLLTGQPQRAWSGVLQGMLIPTFISLGAMFHLAVHSAANAKWNVPVRRLIEGLTSGFFITFLAFIAIAIFGGSYLYEWINLTGDQHHKLFHVHDEMGTKEQFMNKPRWIIANGVIILLWLYFRDRMLRLSLDQDLHKQDIRAKHLRYSIPFLMFFALSLTFFVWDMLLSLHVNWFSTMWGVYCFASAVQTFLCVLVLLVVWLRNGPMKQHLQEHTVHDIGTWMVAWSCFCAYIGFSQYMLQWYANLDEETYFYVIRTQHGYGTAYVIEALIRWPLCFLGLMSQSVRTKTWALRAIAIAVLVGNWMDWSWIIMPAFSQNAYRPFWSWQEVLIGAGFAGAFILIILRFWRRYGLIPEGDPQLLKTMNAEHLH
jgi:hypothetical protein